MKPIVKLSVKDFQRLVKAPTFRSVKTDGSILSALHEHYVLGRDSDDVCQKFNLSPPRFSSVKTQFMRAYHEKRDRQNKQELIFANSKLLLLDAEAVSSQLFPLMVALNGEIRAAIGQVSCHRLKDGEADLRRIGLMVGGIWEWLMAFINRAVVNWNVPYKNVEQNPARQGWNMALRNAKNIYKSKRLAYLREELLLDWDNRPLWYQNCQYQCGRVRQFADYPTPGCCPDDETFETVCQSLEADFNTPAQKQNAKLRRNCLRAWAVNGNLPTHISQNFGVPYYLLWRWLTRFCIHYTRIKSQDFDTGMLYQDSIRPYLPVCTDYGVHQMPLIAAIRKAMLDLAVAEQGKKERMAALGQGVEEWLNAFAAQSDLLPVKQELAALRPLHYEEGDAVSPELYQTVAWNVCAECYAAQA